MNSDIICIDYETKFYSDGKKFDSKCFDKMKELSKDIEIFMHESPYNKYQPPAPEGWTAFRSHKRRLFVKNGYQLNDINNLLKENKAVELPLVKAFDSL